MEAVFLKLVNMSITASYLAVSVMLFRFLFRRAPKSIRVILWGLVGLRLVLPFSFESVLSLIPSVEPFPQTFLYAARPQVQTGISSVNNALNPIIAASLEPQPLTSANPTQIYAFLFSQIWILGMVLMGLYAFISYLIVRKRVRESIPVTKKIYLCDHIGTPFILGIFNPRIYLPSDLDQATADHVLSHETAHLKRKDHWWKPLGFLLLSIHWFNPVMWVAYILLCRDIELACDEKVISDMDSTDKMGYSAALLECSIPRHLISACPVAFGEIGVKTRVKSVRNYKKPTLWIMAVCLIVCIIVAVCFLTDPAGVPINRLSEPDFSKVESITVDSPDDHYEIITEAGIQAVSDFLGDIRVSRNEISQNRDENRDHTHTITLHFDSSDHRFCFSGDLSQIWIDDGVKPTLTHAVMNPERADQFFLSTIEAPVVPRLEVGTYKPVDLIYMTPFSSYLPMSLVNEYTYQVTEKGFYTQSTAFICNTNVDFVDWGWKTVAQSQEELAFFYEWQGLDFVPQITLDDHDLYQKLDNGNHLLLVNNKLWMIHGGTGRNQLEQVWGIYQLVPESEAYREPRQNVRIGNPVQTTLDISDPFEFEVSLAIREHQDYEDQRNIAVYFESHITLSEMVTCGAATEDGSPLGYTEVEVIAMVMSCAEKDGGIEVIETKLVPAIIGFEEWPNDTYARESYLQPEDGEEPEAFIKDHFSSVALETYTSLIEYEKILRDDCLEQAEQYFFQ